MDTETDPHAPSYEQTEDSSGDSGFMAGLFEAAGQKESADTPTGEVETETETETETENESEGEESSNESEGEESESETIDTENDPDFEDAPPIQKESNKIGWKKLKQLKATAEKERDEMKAELAKLRANPPSAANTADIEALRAELEASKTQLADYDQKMALLDVEQSREYRTNIAEPLQRAEELIQSFAEKYQLDVRDIAKAATTPNVLDRNQLLSEIVGGMNDFDKYEFKRVVDEAKTLYDRSMQVKRQAQESKKFLEESRTKEQEAQRQKRREENLKVSDSVWEGLKTKLPFLKEGNEELSRLASEVKEADLSEAPIETQAYARYAAVLLPNLASRLEAQAKEIETLKQSLAKRGALSPSVRSGAVSKSTKSGKSFMDGLDEILS